MEIDEKDVSPGTVLGDLEEIHDTLESALPRQRPSDVRQRDRQDRGDDDMAVTQLIATSHFDMATLPDPNRAGDCAAANTIAKLFGEDHGRRSPSDQRAASCENYEEL
jgi:hypothetical protein